MKKLMIFIVVTTLLAIGCILPAVAAESSLTVLVRIDGKDGTLFYEEITTNNRANYSIPSILMLADNQSGTLTIKGLNYGYITEINEVKIGQAPSGKDVYTVLVNGARVPFEELKTYELKSGDKLTVYYADNYGESIMFPIVDTKKIENGYIKFFCEKPSEDGRSITTEPIAGATVTWYCDSVPFSYVTDGQGGVYIEKTALTSGSHKVSIELKDENGIPLVMPLEPDYTVDIAVGIGDSFALYACVGAMLASLLGAFAIATSLKSTRRAFGIHEGNLE